MMTDCVLGVHGQYCKPCDDRHTTFVFDSNKIISAFCLILQTKRYYFLRYIYLLMPIVQKNIMCFRQQTNLATVITGGDDSHEENKEINFITSFVFKKIREDIAMKPHLYGILTSIVVQEHLYSFLNLHLLVELLCLGR